MIESFLWTNASVGPHILTARSVDSLQKIIRSEPVRITVDPDAKDVVSTTFFPWTWPPPSPTPYADYSLGIFGFSRIGNTNQPLTVFFNARGTATPGLDYVFTNRITFAPGQRYANSPLQAIDDELLEGDETVTFELQPNPAYTVANTNSATGIIFDNEGTNFGPHLEIITPRHKELFQTGSNIEFKIIARDPNGYIPKVELHTLNRIRRSELNFTNPPAPGTPVEHTIILSNALAGAYQFIVLKGYDSNGNLRTTNTLSLAVGNLADRMTLALSSSDREAAERPTNGVPDTASFVIRRVSGPTNQPVRYFISMSGTATNGVDFQAVPLTGIIPMGVSSTNIVISPIQDNTTEGIETITVRLLDPGCWTNLIINPNDLGCYMVDTNSSAELVIQDGQPGTNQPPQVTIQFPRDGAIALKLAGAPGQVCVVERSEDLVNWTTAAEVFLTERELEYVDHEAGQTVRRYYR